MSDGVKTNPELLIISADLPGDESRSNRPAGLNLNQAVGDGSLAGQLFTTALQHHASPALTAQGQQWTYGDLLHASAAIAHTLLESDGFQPGSRVVLLMPNSSAYAAAFYGILLAGGVVIPLPPSVERTALDRIIESTEATAVLTSKVASRKWSTQLTDCPQRSVSLADVSQTAEQTLPGLSAQASDLAAVFFTAGSTGTPKGVMLSHGNLLSNARSIQQYLSIDSTERPLCVLPFFHAFGNSVLQSHLLAGAHLVVDGSTVFPESIVEAMNRHQATSLSGVPDLFRVLLERTSLDAGRIPSLRYMAVAGGALQHDLKLQVHQRIQPARFVVMYGQTEATARLAYVPADRLTDLPAGCIGRAIPDVTLEIVDEHGQPVAEGSTGELRATGPNIMLGYWRDADGTAERIRDGWLYTGDLASADADGWIRHQGRKNSIVKIAGFRVHPADLEEFALRSLPVKHAVAVPFEAAAVGTRMALFVVPDPQNAEPDTSQLLAACRTELPRHLVPEFLHSMQEFPLNHAMKIDRSMLTRIAETHVNERIRISA